jgi:hypothetical protein
MIAAPLNSAEEILSFLSVGLTVDHIHSFLIICVPFCFFQGVLHYEGSQSMAGLDLISLRSSEDTSPRLRDHFNGIRRNSKLYQSPNRLNAR